MTTERHEYLGACRTSFGHEARDCARVLLVGEDNPLSEKPEHALFPYPEGCAGWRLCDILGLRNANYLALWRTNLCVGGWSKVKARDRSHVLQAPNAEWRTIVLLGKKVAEAFEFTGKFFARQEYQHPTLGSEHTWMVVSLPHPSGRNLIWNDPLMAKTTRQLMREVEPGIPWGEESEGGA